jgi:hypothetical protein
MGLLQYAKVRIVDEVTGREVTGYLKQDALKLRDGQLLLVSEERTGIVRRFKVGDHAWRMDAV